MFVYTARTVAQADVELWQDDDNNPSEVADHILSWGLFVSASYEGAYELALAAALVEVNDLYCSEGEDDYKVHQVKRFDKTEGIHYSMVRVVVTLVGPDKQKEKTWVDISIVRSEI